MKNRAIEKKGIEKSGFTLVYVLWIVAVLAAMAVPLSGKRTPQTHLTYPLEHMALLQVAYDLDTQHTDVTVTVGSTAKPNLNTAGLDVLFDDMVKNGLDKAEARRLNAHILGARPLRNWSELPLGLNLLEFLRTHYRLHDDPVSVVRARLNGLKMEALYDPARQAFIHRMDQ